MMKTLKRLIVTALIPCMAFAGVPLSAQAAMVSTEQAMARISAQVTRGERLAAADDVLDNNGTPEQLRAAVDALWTRWHQPA